MFAADLNWFYASSSNSFNSSSKNLSASSTGPVWDMSTPASFNSSMGVSEQPPLKNFLYPSKMPSSPLKIFLLIAMAAEKRATAIKEERFNSYQKVTLDNLFSQIAQGEMKELPIIVKADVQGSAEAVKQSLEKISNDEVRVKVIHAAVGAINKSDVMLASASNAVIIGFNVRPDATAKRDAEQNNVELRLYRVIYDAINDVKDAMKGMLAPKFREVELGQAEVRSVYKISSVGTIAGCYVKSGKVARNAKIRLVRDGIVITEDEIASLRRFKDDVKEVQQNFECGIGLEKYQDIKEGDIFESFIIEEYREE